MSAADTPYWLASLRTLVPPDEALFASRTISGPLTWNSELLGAEVGEEVAALTARTSRDLILYGCGELANYLARQHLVDEVRFWMHPYVWGRGVRPFEPGEMPMPLRLLSTKTYTSGLVRLTYEPAG